MGPGRARNRDGMSCKQKKEKLFKLLEKTQSQLELWRETHKKALAQLSSISNLTEQLEALQRCEGSDNLGVAGQHPMVVPLLQTKIVQSMERALGYVHRERRILTEVVQRLKRYAKEGETTFEELVGIQGLEASCARTAESFSPSDHVQWLTQLHTAYRCDLNEKMSALESLQYTSECMGRVCRVWGEEPDGVQEYLKYTLSVGCKN